jgi:hypothetical protein
MSETETLRRIAEAVHGYDATECMADHQRRLADVVAALANAPVSGVEHRPQVYSVPVSDVDVRYRPSMQE